MSKLSATAFVAILCIVLAVLPAESRKPPFNGSIFGKRFQRDMDVESKGADFRHPACEYVYEACNQWYSNGQDSQ